MKILVIGSNGREHALAAKYSQSKKTDIVFIAPGNGLTDYKTKKSKMFKLPWKILMPWSSLRRKKR